MNTVNQIFAISLMNLKNLGSRRGASLVVVIGIAGVVAVLVALLAMAAGFESTLSSSGSAQRALILRAGSTSEMNGNISLEQTNIIMALPGIKKDKNTPVITQETYVSVNFEKSGSAETAYLTMRGISPESFQVRPEVEIISGRKVEFGRFEIMVGRGAQSQFQGFEIGNSIAIKGAQWKIVGLFAAQGSAFESEIWADKNMVNAVFQRGITSMLAQLETAESLGEFSTAVASDRRLNVKVLRESDYYNDQSQTTTQLIKTLAAVVISIMALGAVFAALNTMYSAVAARSIEIATLRALGFSSTAVVVSVLIESLCLALIGGSIGGVLTSLIFNGYTVSTIGATSTQVAFDFQVSYELIGMGIALALLLGAIGGLLPAISSVRRDIITALRSI